MKPLNEVEVQEEVEDFNGNRNLSGKRGRKYGCWLTYSGLIQVCKELFEIDNLPDADTEDEMIFGKYK